MSHNVWFMLIRSGPAGAANPRATCMAYSTLSGAAGAGRQPFT
jgi:hypothetical protein